MKRSRLILGTSIFFFLVSIFVLCFVFQYPFTCLFENIFIAICTSCIVAIPNFFISFYGKQQAVNQRIEKILFSLESQINDNFPKLTYISCPIEQLKEYKASVGKLADALSRMMNEEYFFAGGLEKQFTLSMFRFFNEISDLTEHYKDGENEFKWYVDRIEKAKDICIQRIRTIQDYVSTTY